MSAGGEAYDDDEEDGPRGGPVVQECNALSSEAGMAGLVAT